MVYLPTQWHILVRHVTTSPSKGGTQVRWMGRGQDMDEIGQVGGHGWDAGEVGGMRAGGTRARRRWDMGECK